MYASTLSDSTPSACDRLMRASSSVDFHFASFGLMWRSCSSCSDAMLIRAATSLPFALIAESQYWRAPSALPCFQ